jgi:hypothetical protein
MDGVHENPLCRHEEFHEKLPHIIVRRRAPSAPRSGPSSCPRDCLVVDSLCWVQVVRHVRRRGSSTRSLKSPCSAPRITKEPRKGLLSANTIAARGVKLKVCMSPHRTGTVSTRVATDAAGLADLQGCSAISFSRVCLCAIARSYWLCGLQHLMAFVRA